MIRGTFRYNGSEEVVSFTLAGHAGFGESGEDVVCAAVSAVSIGTVNNLERIAGFQPIVESDEENGGYLYVTLPNDLSIEKQTIAQILLTNLRYTLEDVEQEATDFITIKIKH